MCNACEPAHGGISRRRLIQAGGAGAAVLAGLGLLRSAQADEHEPHWTYEGSEGPEHWGEHEAYALCSAGTEQSPIDVSGAAEGDLANIEFDYQVVSQLEIVNNGHTELVAIPEGSSITLDGKPFPLKQFHFHAPSEHTIDGVAEAMELHMVHTAEDGAIAVIGLLLADGAENLALKSVFEAMPAMAGPSQVATGSIDLNALLPAQLTTFRYMGSLTTPPCSEGVQWLLMTERSTVSAAQVTTFLNAVGEDARPVQPLNERPLLEDATP